MKLAFYSGLSFLLGGCMFSCSSQKSEVADQEPVATTLTTPTTLYTGQTIDTTQLLQTIAIGSCSRQDLPQIMWPNVLANNPDLWIWLGDNIYGDTQDMEEMEQKYLQQKSDSLYQVLRSKMPVLGIWDDHDFGVNDGDYRFSQKRASQQLLLDFLDVPKDAPVRTREGAYQSYVIGPKGKQIKFIFLDARYFRDTLAANRVGNQRYKPNMTGDVLGETQWRWFENELKSSTAQVHVIGCGIQMMAEEQGFEKWANFPTARKRLFDLLATSNTPNTLLMSGDRHIAELAKMELEGKDQPIFEITASGLTHSYEAADESNRYRISPLIGKKNFGLIKIDWSNSNQPSVTVEIRGLKNVIHHSEQIF